MNATVGAPPRITRGGLLGSLLLLVVVLGCVRLGFWQLARRAERAALNERVAARMQLEPASEVGQLTDTAASLYRIASLPGTWDAERSIVLPGRSLGGVPGVHLLTPLRIGDERAVLVNRGWVPAADGATIDPGAFPPAGDGAHGLVLPFPGGAAPAPVHDALADSGFRRVWYAMDAAALRAQFPYELTPFVIQLLPGPAPAAYPRRLAPPALDPGPHLSYALQWFGFAIIGVIGWFALVLRSRRPPRIAPPLLFACALALAPAGAGAQLRPLDPFDWRILDEQTALVAGAGGGITFDQPAPLSGTEGRLLELGTWRLLLRSGRMGLDLYGITVWRYSERDTLEAPYPGVDPAEHGVRQDFGPAGASAFVRVSPQRWSTDLLIRFGARLPTTSHASGLERDETDFYALAGARRRVGPWQLSGEAGVGIHGSVRADYRQSDVLIYNVGARRQTGPLALSASLVGHMDGHDWRVRGNEDQSELRLGLRAGRGRWVEVGYIRGLTRFSPSHGLQIAVGLTAGCGGDCLP
ncbi:MAG TPA: SURF1 family protein [Longimicrobiales bacterium]|nr:SURF1 family protein [Longimicrobiales bacterium]